MSNRYSPWLLNGSVLEYPVTDSWDYDIDLSTIKTADEALDWIFHLSEKNWGADALPGFVTALRELTDLRRLSQGR